jgi:hypothetical protein
MTAKMKKRPPAVSRLQTPLSVEKPCGLSLAMMVWDRP